MPSAGADYPPAVDAVDGRRNTGVRLRAAVVNDMSEMRSSVGFHCGVAILPGNKARSQADDDWVDACFEHPAVNENKWFEGGEGFGIGIDENWDVSLSDYSRDFIHRFYQPGGNALY